MAREDEADEDFRERLESLLRAPDFSAARANARLELHEAVCSERHGTVLHMIQQLATGNAALHERLNVVSNRMWLAVVSVCSAAVIALCSVVFYMITRGMK